MVGRVLLGVAVFGIVSGRVHADPTPASVDPTPRRFFAFGYGWGGESRLANAARSYNMGAIAFQFGQRLGPGLQLVEQFDTTPESQPFPGSTLWESHVVFLAGVRWAPFAPRPRWQPSSLLFPTKYFDSTAFYVGASAGAGLRDRRLANMDVSTGTPVVAAHLGYIPLQGRDWALGYEWREQLEHYSDGFQRGWSLLMTVELH
ncbi:MAG: hypothetical protein JWO36_5986 [Myxococcales bacterium]|nr:hypothetical protein [Myxococcales bacterium]